MTASERDQTPKLWAEHSDNPGKLLEPSTAELVAALTARPEAEVIDTDIAGEYLHGRSRYLVVRLEAFEKETEQ